NQSQLQALPALHGNDGLLGDLVDQPGSKQRRRVDLAERDARRNRQQLLIATASTWQGHQLGQGRPGNVRQLRVDVLERLLKLRLGGVGVDDAAAQRALVVEGLYDESGDVVLQAAAASDAAFMMAA